ncbi:segregation/condensation protein A [Streptomyces sp. NPDC056891]|uniref:segregation/condensation protein A n=1 Tax=Streptomyces sp. NPDC056891 TaxID=3345961 RepID=UPI0036C1FEC4
MHHASDETSRPPRRRALGRGPGDPEGPAAAGAVRDGHGAAVGEAIDVSADRGAGVAALPEPAIAPGYEPEPVAGLEPEAGREREARSERGAGLRAEPGPTAVAPAPARPEVEPEIGLRSGSEPEARLATEVVAEPEPERVAEPEPEREAEPEREREPEREAEPEPEPEPEREAEPAVGAAAGSEPAVGGEGGDGRFTVRLANFEGPFDLLLQLITKHKLDVTEVALSQVTDEFMAHLRALGPDGDLDQTTEFLVVAATLLDLKAARLLPAAEVEDEADLALLEARDLLFARLLQYRAYKRVAAIFEERWEAEGRRHPRTVGLEPHHAELLPEVVISIGAEGFARLAVKAMQPRAEPQVYVDHIHAPLVSVREQAAVVVSLLRERGTALFRELIEDVGDDTLTVVARFLALLELYREKAVALDQETALGDLTVSWTGGETDPTAAVTDEFDQETTA